MAGGGRVEPAADAPPVECGERAVVHMDARRHATVACSVDAQQLQGAAPLSPLPPASERRAAASSAAKRQCTGRCLSRTRLDDGLTAAFGAIVLIDRQRGEPAAGASIVLRARRRSPSEVWRESLLECGANR